MELTQRQREIITIVKAEQPISGDKIAKHLKLTRPTLRNDLSILTMTGILDAKPKVGYFYSGQHLNPLTFETIYEVPVETLMLTPILIKPTTTVQDAITSLFMNDVGSLYVADDDQHLVGVVSRKDLLRASLIKQDLTTIVAAVIMTRMPNIVTITATTRLLDAGYLLSKHQVDTLPVLDKAGVVVGKVTKTKLLDYFINAGAKVDQEKYH